MGYDFRTVWEQETEAHRQIFSRTVDALENGVGVWVGMAETVVRRGGKLMFCGNGGSAADAQHIAAELSVKLCQERPPIAALCLSLDPSAMTACANDFGYAQVFARQVEALGREGDLLVGLTTSGNSLNVMAAMVAAKAKGIPSVILTGEGGGKAAPLADLALRVPCSDSTARIQEMHIMIGHIFCRALEQRLGLASG